MTISFLRFALRAALSAAACASTFALLGCSSAGLVSTQGSGRGDGGAAAATPGAKGANGDTAGRPQDAGAADAVASASAATDLHGTFTAKSASFDASVTDDGDRMLDIVFADALEMCSSPRTADFTPVLHVTLRAAANATLPGTYPIAEDTMMGGSGPTPSGTAVMWNVYDVGTTDLCSLSTVDELTGTVTITEASATRVTGTVALKGGTQLTGSIQGTFSAQTCGAIGKHAFACPLTI